MYQSFKREVAGVVLRAAVVLVTIVGVVYSLSVIYDDVEGNISDGECNVAVLPVEGTILPYHGLFDAPLIITPGVVEDFMATAENDRFIKAVLVEINTPGGTPVASERIAERINNSSIPVVGLIGDMGASGGYMVAAATSHLLASKMSDVGGIGVNMSYVEESEKNEEEGLTYVQLMTGKFKDAGTPNRPITNEERELFQRDLDIVHNAFIDIVAKYRNLPREEVETVADGATMTGQIALEYGLIDELGGREEARTVIANILDIQASDVVFCEYEPDYFIF